MSYTVIHCNASSNNTKQFYTILTNIMNYYTTLVNIVPCKTTQYTIIIQIENQCNMQSLFLAMAPSKGRTPGSICPFKTMFVEKEHDSSKHDSSWWSLPYPTLLNWMTLFSETCVNNNFLPLVDPELSLLSLSCPGTWCVNSETEKQPYPFNW